MNEDSLEILENEDAAALKTEIGRLKEANGKLASDCEMYKNLYYKGEDDIRQLKTIVKALVTFMKIA